MRRNLIVVLFMWMAGSASFGQTPLHGLVAGQSVRADVERVAGKPTNVYSQTLVEYHPQEFDPKSWGSNVAKIYVQYRTDSPIVERIEVLVARTISRSDTYRSLEQSTSAAHQPTLPDQPSLRGKNNERLVEYFGAPYYIVLTYKGADVNSGVDRIARYSRELFESAVSSNVSTTPAAPQAGGVSPASQGLPGSGYLGIGVRGITLEQAKALGLQTTEGALITRLAVGAPADRAGLKQGDVIVGFGGERVSDSKELVTKIWQTAPGTRMAMDIVRSGERLRITAIVGQKPAPSPAPVSGGNAPISQPLSASAPVALSDDLAAVLRPLETQRAHIFTLSLVTPISTASSKAGDLVQMQVLSTDATQGAQVTGTILNSICTGSGSPTPRCLVDFTLDWMTVKGQNIPVVGRIIKVAGARGQRLASEEGNSVSIISNYMDAVQKPTMAASINNQPLGPHQQVYHELNVNGTSLSLEPGSGFQVSFNSDFGRLPQ